jgi:hypothetical protein
MSTKNELRTHWCIAWLMLAGLLVYWVIAYRFSDQLQQPIPEAQRIVVRTVFYGLVIIGLPITNLIRHIMLRLNQTMPGNKPANVRYLITVMVSMILVESIGVIGLIMFILGDGFNTFYIFTGLSALGLYLYRPKADEYEAIVESLTQTNQQ